MNYLIIISLLCYLVLICLNSYHMLQQNLYNENNRYVSWIFKNIKNNFNIFNFILVIIAFLTKYNNIFNYILLPYIIIIFIIEYKRRQANKINVKKPLVVTARIKRLMIITYSIAGLIIVLFIKEEKLLYLILSLIIMFNNAYIYLINIIAWPVEKMVYNKFYRSARRKIISFNQLNIVGVTGSYGKTSCKNIINELLSVKYNSVTTPKSINTFNGLMIFINNKLDKFDNVFVAELGAYVVGEIKKLCKLVTPNIGVITTIGLAHLATFKSEDNITKGKFELIESLPKGGYAVLNADDDKQVNYKIKNDVKVAWIGIKNTKLASIYATDIKQTQKGLECNIHIRENNSIIMAKTSLLGYNNIYNILSAVAIGYYLGLTKEELTAGLRKVRPTEHRLELKSYKHLTLIDDAYNANPSGAKMALDVLNLMDGKKVIVTPGMIELGHRQDELNRELGKQIADVCDLVILIGKKQTESIYNGLMDKKYKQDKIKVFENFKDCLSLLDSLESGSTVLLENDLPDIFSEGRK